MSTFRRANDALLLFPVARAPLRFIYTLKFSISFLRLTILINSERLCRTSGALTNAPTIQKIVMELTFVFLLIHMAGCRLRRSMKIPRAPLVIRLVGQGIRGSVSRTYRHRHSGRSRELREVTIISCYR